MKKVWIKIDGVNINATHIVQKGKEAGIKELSVCGGNPGDTEEKKIKWATKAFDFLDKKLKEKPAAENTVKNNS